MIVTLEFLYSRAACQEEVDIFYDLFGEECELNKENLEKYVKANRYAYKGIYWLAIEMLDNKGWGKWQRYIRDKDKRDTDEYAMEIGEKLIEFLSGNIGK